MGITPCLRPSPVRWSLCLPARCVAPPPRIVQRPARRALPCHREIACALILLTTDVLITYGPPRDIGDRTILGQHVGCNDRRAAVACLHSRLHSFGHIHEGAGVTSHGPTTFVNASSCSLREQLTNPPIVIADIVVEAGAER